MKKFSYSLILFTLLTIPSLWGQSMDKDVFLEVDGDKIYGSLRVPANVDSPPVVLIIAGSGPTDRNCNNPQMTNNAYKMLADSLEKEGIATLRYDKRGIAASAGAALDEADLRFEHYVEDAAAWINWLKRDDRFSSVFVFGHSEGALIGMLASKETHPAGYISCAGPGRPADQVIREQVKDQILISKATNEILDVLLEGRTVDSIPPILNALFRPSVQPYLISWMKYDPAREISTMASSTLIIQGDTDIQVGVKDAQLLKENQPDAELIVIEGMNHVLKPSPMDYLPNIATYSKPELGLHSGLVPAITRFIQSNE
jgi:alpha/beta superfamily hydrolase